MNKYLIKCLKCEAEREIAIKHTAVGDIIDWLETPEVAYADIMSGRKRLDNQFGFQCRCGNNDLLTNQELDHFSSLSHPKPQEIEEIINNLQPQDPQFAMVKI